MPSACQRWHDTWNGSGSGPSLQSLPPDCQCRSLQPHIPSRPAVRSRPRTTTGQKKKCTMLHLDPDSTNTWGPWAGSHCICTLRMPGMSPVPPSVLPVRFDHLRRNPRCELGLGSGGALHGRPNPGSSVLLFGRIARPPHPPHAVWDSWAAVMGRRGSQRGSQRGSYKVAVNPKFSQAINALLSFFSFFGPSLMVSRAP